MNDKPRRVSRVEVCGGIASGKTTMTALLVEFGLLPLFETFDANPFWADFYMNPGEYIFETEISFILQHYHHIKVASRGAGTFGCDFSFALDGAYGDIGLQGTRKAAFDLVHQQVLEDIGEPMLLIHLSCAPEIELERVRGRARPVESTLDVPFLTRLNEAVAQRVQEGSASQQTIEIDSGATDFARSRSGREQVIELVRTSLRELPGAGGLTL